LYNHFRLRTKDDIKNNKYESAPHSRAVMGGCTMNKASAPAPDKARSAAKPRAKTTRQVIVNPGLQLRMLLPVAIFACFMAILMYAFVFQPIAFDARTDPSPMVRALLSGRLASLQLHFWIALGFTGVIAALYALIHSNRLAGPIYKLRVVLAQLADGNMMQLRFRKGDEFREFEDIVGKLVKRMETLSSGNAKQMSYFQRRLTWLRSRVEAQNLERADICKELDSALQDAGMDQYQMRDV
jgi:hypothetical protein